MATIKNTGKVLESIKVKTNTFLGSVYSQIVGVSVSDSDVTLEFVYKHPRPEITDAQVVARVTMPRKSGEELAKTILNTVQVHEAKKGGKSND